jgi:hypothetical protein
MPLTIISRAPYGADGKARWNVQLGGELKVMSADQIHEAMR